MHHENHTQTSISFASPEAKRNYVKDMFGKIAKRYDLMNDLMTFGLHRLWKKQACKLLSPASYSTPKLLDLACGTGDLCFMLQRLYPQAQITGVDFSEEMLEQAKNRQQAQSTRSPSEIDFVQADALKLPFAEESFDGILISYGLRNMPDYRAALQEVWRIAKPGAKLVILDMSFPRGFWKYASIGHRLVVLPIMGQLVAGSAESYSYLPNSIHQYLQQQELVQLLLDCQWQQAQYQDLLGGVSAIHTARKASSP